MKTFSEQYVFLVYLNLKKQKFIEVFKFCDLLFIYLFCTILYEYLKILRKDDPSMLVKTKPIHVNTEKNPDFYFFFIFLKSNLMIKYFFLMFKMYTDNENRKK